MRALARAVCVEAAAAAGLPGPGRDDPPEALLQSARSAIAATAEVIGNQRQQIARLRDVGEEPAAPQPVRRAALTLAELRDRLRALSSVDDSGAAPPAAGLGWIVQRLDEALDQLGVVEYEQSGTADPARQQVVDRRPADAEHPSGTVAASVRSGLLLADQVLRPQQIVVYAPDEGRADGQR